MCETLNNYLNENVFSTDRHSSNDAGGKSWFWKTFMLLCIWLLASWVNEAGSWASHNYGGGFSTSATTSVWLSGSRERNNQNLDFPRIRLGSGIFKLALHRLDKEYLDFSWLAAARWACHTVVNIYNNANESNKLVLSLQKLCSGNYFIELVH
jgi:hypothetical protein